LSVPEVGGVDARYTLKRNISDESLAYGFTLSVWGSGAILLDFAGAVKAEYAVAFGFGTIISFGLLTAFVFNSLLEHYEIQARQTRVVASMIHVLGAVLNVAVSYLLTVYLWGKVFPEAVFFVVGLHVMATYNLMLLVEILLSERLYRFFRGTEPQSPGHDASEP
jgi:putative flippase GtrA